MARTWLSITVELVEGGTRIFWPRPGRIFAAARPHTFADLAVAIDDAYARWDRAHLHEFRLVDDQRIGRPDDNGDESGAVLDDRRIRLSRLGPGERFLYVFDFGDAWHHLCTVGEQRIDPLEQLGIVPAKPLAYWGWGDLPDQYGRRFPGDDGEPQVPPPSPDRPAAVLPVVGPRRRPLPRLTRQDSSKGLTHPYSSVP